MTESRSLPLPRKLALAGEIVVAYVRIRRLLRRRDLRRTLEAIRTGAPAGRPPTGTSDERLAGRYSGRSSACRPILAA